MQADLMSMKDRPLMVTSVKRFGVLRKIPLLLIVNRNGMAVRRVSFERSRDGVAL